MPAWLGFCSGDQPQREPLTGYTIADLNSASLLGLFPVFDAYLKRTFHKILEQFLDVSAERASIFSRKLFKFGL